MKHLIIEEINNIITLSETNKQSEIAEKYGVSQTFIGKILRANGIKHKRTRLNLSRLALDINYFDEIDSPKKAYWLGFIAADGSLKNNKVSITSKDLEILEKFKKDLQSEHTITPVQYIDKRTKKKYSSYTLQVTNSLFTEKLTKYIPINKSDIFKFPNIEIKFYPDFIAGMIDGDGSFSLKNDKCRTLVVNLISTKECLIHIQEYLLMHLGINKTTLQSITKNKPNVWKLYIYAGAKQFLDLIYKNQDKTMYLTRKQTKLNKIIKTKYV